MGSVEISKLGFRESWAFIGLKGSKKYAVEVRNKKSKGSLLESAMGFAKITKKVKEEVQGGSEFKIESAGFEAGNYARIFINGK